MIKTIIRANALFLLAVVCFCNSVTAQIEVVGDEYSANLKGSNSCYDRDVNFESYFPPINTLSILETYGEFCPKVSLDLNMTGDTLYLCKDENFLLSYSFAVNEKGATNRITMPKGYYVVNGYVFCVDNGYSLLKNYGMDTVPLRTYYSELSIKKLKEDILKGDHVSIKYYLMYIVLKPVDTSLSTTYYVFRNNIDMEESKYFIPVRFYNEVRKFIGKKIELEQCERCVHFGWIKDNKIGRDGMTGDLMKLQDTIFTCVNVVLKKDRFYVVLSGEKTGSFSLRLDKLKYVYEWEEMNKSVNLEDSYNRSNYSIRDIPLLVTDWNKHDQYIVKNEDLVVLKKRTKMARAQRESEWKKREVEFEQTKKNKSAERKKKMIANYGNKYGELVAKYQVALGMTKKMCEDAWGFPMNTYRTTTSFGQSEVWCYNYKTKVYFYNGKVVQIDN